jgi:hypothetical protein
VAESPRQARRRGGAAVLVAALVLPLHDPALVVALILGMRGSRLILEVDS